MSKIAIRGERYTINSTINYLGFKEEIFEKIVIEETDTEINAFVKLKRSLTSHCKFCDSKNIYIKEYKLKKIVHKHFTGKKCIIFYYRRRFLCNECKKTFYESNPFSFSDDVVSYETVLYILEELTTTQSFKDVAIKSGISINKVIDIFDKYVSIEREPMPKVLGIDEFHNKSYGDEKYACILINNNSEKPSIVDIVKDRKVDTLSYYFQYIPAEERKNVNFFVSDMYDEYRYVHDTWFPSSIHIIDTYHIIRLFTDALRRIRIKIMKQFSKDSDEYYILKKYSFVLEISKKKFKEEKIFFKKFNKEMNYYDLLNLVLNVSDDLRNAYFVKDFYCNHYYMCTYKEASGFIDETISKLCESKFEIYHEVADSLTKWKKEICNSFLIIKDRRITNARTEGFNNLVKVIKRCGYGYSCFKRFRNRILHIQKHNKKIYLVKR